MSSPSSEVGEPAKFAEFTKEERINQLNEIDKRIAQLLQSAGLALKSLSPLQNSDGASISGRKEAFQAATDAYLRTLNTVDVHLKRQIYGLQEANIIPAEKAKKVVVQEEVTPDQMARGQVLRHMHAKPPPETIADGGMGKLDKGFLNTNSGIVGRDMEAELWEKSRVLLEGIMKESSGGVDGSHDEDTEMKT